MQPQQQTKPRRVAFADARRFYRELEPVAFRFGFALALYGSTLREGTGRDLDLVAVNVTRDEGTPADEAELAKNGLIDAICGRYSGRVLQKSPDESLANASMGTTIYSQLHNIIIDVLVRE